MPTWNQFPPGNPEALLHAYTYWGNLNESNVTPTSYRLDFYGNASSYIIVEGSGFQFFYDDEEEHLYDVGTVTSFTLYTAAGYPIAQVTDLSMLPFTLLGTLLSTSAATLRSAIEGQAWTFNGSAGNDTITAGNLADVVVAHSGNDTVNGLMGNDQLFGGSGNDVLDGGLNADLMDGGLGNDTFYVDNAADTVVEAAIGGTDVIIASASYTLQAGVSVEEMRAVGAMPTTSINLTGNELANKLLGNAGANVLFGGGGADTLNGGDGNDSYQLAGDTTDTLIDSSGTDLIWSTITRSLASYAMIENLTLQGSGDINGTGNDLNNAITGNSGVNTLTGGIGNDTLDGGADADTLNGGADNDTYVLAAEDDTIIDASGLDTITSTITRSLVDYSMIEYLTLKGTANINGTGNGLSNLLIGNDGKNSLKGGALNDVLRGGLGTDTLYGETGNDRFQFMAVTDSAVGATRDVIGDLDDQGEDVVDLSLMAGVTTYIGTAAFSAAGQVRVQQAGANVLVQINTVGNDTAESEILFAGATLGAGLGQIDASDFLL